MKNVFKRILVPIDGSEHADKALDCALDLAEKYSATIELLNVFSTAPITMGYPASMVYAPTTAGYPTWASTYSKESRANNEKMLSEALKKAKKTKPNLDISTKLVEGRTADKIVETAKDGNFDLIVMGSRGLGGIKEFLLGSVSNRVADDAECPVMIVK